MLVDFWAPWCGPCKQLAPVLEKAVADAKGKVTLVKMNIDEHPQIAGQLGIQSIPAVIAFDRGQPVDGFMGALPDSQVRAFIERLVGPLSGGSDALIAEAEAAAGGWRRGGRRRTLRARARGGGDQPEGAWRPCQAACRRRRSRPGARCAVDGLAPGARKRPGPGDRRRDGRAASGRTGGVASAIWRRLQKALAANPDDHQARFDLAVALNANGERDKAADELLTIIKRDRAWNEAARAQAAAAVLRGLGPDGQDDGRRAAQVVGDLVLMAPNRRPKKALCINSAPRYVSVSLIGLSLSPGSRFSGV